MNGECVRGVGYLRSGVQVILELTKAPDMGDNPEEGRSIVMVHFISREPPTQEDQEETHLLVRSFMEHVGLKPMTLVDISVPTDTREEAARKMRAFFGGGLG